MIQAWTGGTTPRPIGTIGRAERRIVSALFREQLATWCGYWGDRPDRLTLRRFWHRARGDAWATVRAWPETLAELRRQLRNAATATGADLVTGETSLAGHHVTATYRRDPWGRWRTLWKLDGRATTLRDLRTFGYMGAYAHGRDGAVVG